ncbi:MAG: SMP-30/gluconolactonase/LRE family protein [Halorhabdus sp.]
MVRIERVADTRNQTGEGPLWHPDEQRLYWLDIPRGQLFAYDPDTDDHDVIYETNGDPIGGFTIEADGSLLLFSHRTVERLVPGEASTTVVTEIQVDTRFNDVIADPGGRVFCGTMPGEGSLGDLYRIDTDGQATVVVPGVNIPNGMGFSRDRERFYFTETEERRIDRYDYDPATGTISNRNLFHEVPTGEGVPDGLTVDDEDHVWSARWNGGRIVRYTPDGEVSTEIDIPARKVSSITFGGPEYDALYVTTALADSDRSSEGDGAGALFRVSNLDVSGVPEYRSSVSAGLT